MVDLEVVLSRLKAMNEYVAYLTAHRHLTFEQMASDELSYAAIQRWLQLASQAAIDVGSHILAADFARRADNYRNVLLALGLEGVLPTDFAKKFADIAGFRNVLVRMYTEIDPREVYKALQEGVDDFRLFFEHIVDYLEQSGLPGDEE